MDNTNSKVKHRNSNIIEHVKTMITSQDWSPRTSSPYRSLIMNNNVKSNTRFRAILTTPWPLEIQQSKIPNAGYGVWTGVDLPVALVFGPYEGKLQQGLPQSCYSWMISEMGDNCYMDAADPTNSNWLRYVNCGRNKYENNLMPLQYSGQIFYKTTRPIRRGSELMVWYGDAYGLKLGISRRSAEWNRSAKRNEISSCDRCGLSFQSEKDLYFHFRSCSIIPQQLSSTEVGRCTEISIKDFSQVKSSIKSGMKHVHCKSNVGNLGSQVRLDGCSEDQDQDEVKQFVKDGIEKKIASTAACNLSPFLDQVSGTSNAAQNEACATPHPNKEVEHGLDWPTPSRMKNHSDSYPVPEEAEETLRSFQAGKSKGSFHSLLKEVRLEVTENMEFLDSFLTDIFNISFANSDGCITMFPSQSYPDKELVDDNGDIIKVIDEDGRSNVFDSEKFEKNAIGSKVDNLSFCSSASIHIRRDRQPSNRGAINHLKCIFCGETFPNALSLREHKSIHNIEYSFKCKSCRKKFSDHNVYLSHLTTHVNYMNCSCGAKFIDARTLLSHQNGCSAVKKCPRIVLRQIDTSLCH